MVLGRHIGRVNHLQTGEWETYRREERPLRRERPIPHRERELLRRERPILP